MAYTCVFCGRGPLTTEHVLPRQLAKIFGVENVKRGIHVNQSGGNVPTARRAPLLDAKARVVCAGCNNGWMREVDDAAMPLLTEMLQGRNVRLDKDQQALLATFAVKIAIMLQFTHRQQDQTVIPVHDYAAFYEAKQPSASTTVWFGYTIPPEVDFGDRAVAAVDFTCTPYLGRATGDGVDGDVIVYAWAAVLRIGHLIALIIRLAPPRAAPAPEALAGYLIPVWPTYLSASWPPSDLAQMGGCAALVESLHEPLLALG